MSRKTQNLQKSERTPLTNDAKTPFLDATNDVAFKKIFGDQNHKNCLIDFLNSVLERTAESRILDITHLPCDQVPAIKGFKYTLVDVRCRDARGEEYIPEMQVAASDFFSKRVFYYASHVYFKQLKKAMATKSSARSSSSASST